MTKDVAHNTCMDYIPFKRWEKRRRGRINLCATDAKDVAHNTSMDFIPFKRSEKRQGR